MGRNALIALLVSLGAASQARAAVAVQNTAEVGSGTTGTTVTIASFNPSFRSNLVLVVGLSFGGGVAPASVTVTYGGVALTLVASRRTWSSSWDSRLVEEFPAA